MTTRFDRLFPLLLHLALACVALPASLDAASDDQASDDNPGEVLDRSLAESSELEQKASKLESRIGDTEGLMREVVENRLTRTRMDLLEQSLKFSRSVADQPDSLENYALYRERAVELLRSQTDRARTIAAELRDRVELPADDTSAAEQAAAYSRIFERLHTLDKAYKLYIDSLALSREFGLDVSELEKQVREDLAERAATGSAILDITTSKMSALRASLAAVPDDTEIKARLNVTTSNVSKLAGIMDEVLRLMDSLEMDTRTIASNCWSLPARSRRNFSTSVSSAHSSSAGAEPCGRT